MRKSELIKSPIKNKRENLVFVRAGNQSKHYDLYPLPTERNWDICISCYEDITPADYEQCEFIVSGGLSKWTDFYDQYFQNQNSIQGYKRYMVSDNDVQYSHKSHIDALFQISDQLDLLVAQGSLCENSYCSWKVTKHHPGAVARYTNFVECMAPIFHKDALNILEPLLKEAISGFGLDVVFWDALGRPKNKVGVIDLVKIHHLKPIDSKGGEWYQFLKNNGVDLSAEVYNFMSRYGLKEFDIQTLGFIPKPEKIISPEL